MVEYSREQLWKLIKDFVKDSCWKYYGSVTDLKQHIFYKSTSLFGSYNKFKDDTTTWLCFTGHGQEIKNGIYISIYINRHRNGNQFILDNIELCYASSEKIQSDLCWNKDNLPKTKSTNFPQSHCAATYTKKEIESDICKEKFLNKLDFMIKEYKEIFTPKEADTIYKPGDIKIDKIASNKCMTWVEGKLGKELTAQQKQVVGLDYDKEKINAALVIASAGCGKSTTLLGHTLHLIAKEKIKHSDDILLVVFNKKNRQELQEKVNGYGFEHLGAAIHTFHSLGLSIIQTQNPEINSIDPGDSENPFNKVLSQYTDSNTKKGGDDWIKNLWRFGTDINAPKRSEDIYQNELSDDKLKEKICLLENAGYPIGYKNQEEDITKLRLQNFCTLYGIEPTIQLHPYPCFKIQNKIKIYWSIKPINLKENDIFIKEFTPNTMTELREKLEAKNMSLNPISENTLKSAITTSILRARGDIFKRTAQFFITVFKIKYPNGDQTKLEDIRKELLQKYTDTLQQNHINAFFDLLIPIYTDYQNELRDNCQIDFNDMLNLAIKYIKEGTVTRKYKYILVDEFQDVAKDNFELLQALQEKTGAKLMCVGDDWQSIYAWRGSDLEYFENFKKYFPNSKKLFITETFRNGERLVKTAAEFVRQDKELNDKQPSSNQPETLLIPFYYNSRNIKKQWEKLKEDINTKYPQKEIAFLGRYHADNNISGTQIPSEHFITMHKSKGLEKDVIVILNLKNTPPYGFPSSVKGDIVLETLYENREEKAQAEERRLFYVALTRARNACYLWIPENNTSEFVQEIMEIYKKTN